MLRRSLLFFAYACLAACGGGGAREDGGTPRPRRDAAVPPPSCTNLAEPGTWEFISPNDHETAAIAVDPFDPAVLYTSADGIYRSADCGGTWERVNTTENGLPGTSLNGASPVGIAMDPEVQGTMYIANYRGPQNIWKSTDGGVSWVSLIAGDSEIGESLQYNWYQSIAIDPDDHLHLVAATHANCNPDAFSAGCQVETLDGGETWRLARNPEDASWAENGGALLLNSDVWVYGQPFGKLWITRDHGDDWEDVTPVGGHGTSSGIIVHPVRDGEGNYYLGTLYGVLRSPDGVAWSVVPGLTGRTVGFTSGNGMLFSSDQWSTAYRYARFDDLSAWTIIPPPPGLDDERGAPNLVYEPAHRLLYSSNWKGGLWRMRVPDL